MGFAWAAANANIQVLLQEGGGGGTLGKAMALHMAAVLPTHSAHLICLDDQCTPAHHSTPRRFFFHWPGFPSAHASVQQIRSRLLAVGTADDEDIYSKNRIPVVEGASPVPRGPGLGYEVDESEIRRMSGPTLWFRLRLRRLFGW